LSETNEQQRAGFPGVAPVEPRHNVSELDQIRA
jgi:hypothetical protein